MILEAFTLTGKNFHHNQKAPANRGPEAGARAQGGPCAENAVTPGTGLGEGCPNDPGGYISHAEMRHGNGGEATPGHGLGRGTSGRSATPFVTFQYGNGTRNELPVPGRSVDFCCGRCPTFRDGWHLVEDLSEVGAFSQGARAQA